MNSFLQTSVHSIGRARNFVCREPENREAEDVEVECYGKGKPPPRDGKPLPSQLDWRVVLYIILL